MFRSVRPSSGVSVCNLKLSGIHYKYIVICTEDRFRRTHSLYSAAQTLYIKHQVLKLPLDLRMLNITLTLIGQTGRPYHVRYKDCSPDTSNIISTAASSSYLTVVLFTSCFSYF
jgi:hypothetical protein